MEKNSQKWKNFYYPLKNKLLSNEQVCIALDLLFTDLKKCLLLEGNTIIHIQFKIKIKHEYRSVSYLQTVNLSEFDELKAIFCEFLMLRDQDYILSNPSHIVFTYKLENSNSPIQSKINRPRSIIRAKEETLSWKGYILPNTMDFTQWGKVLFVCDSSAKVKKINSISIYHIELSDKQLKATLKIKNKVILEFTDTIVNTGNLSSFIRTINNNTYYFIDGNCILKTIKKKTKFLKSIEKTPWISKNFITMDLETRNINGVLTPYAVSTYDGKNFNSFYLSDFKDSDSMIKASIQYLMRPKYSNYKVYLHNFSHFDGIFLIRILSELTDLIIKPIIRDGRIIDLKFSFNYSEVITEKVCNLYFRDSYLLLPSSLRKLAENFQVEAKGIFPYEFVNDENISLSYKGPVPDKVFYPNISEDEYLCHKAQIKEENSIWDLRKETLKYCEQDVKTLHQIINKFQVQIFKLFRLNVLKYPTLSSLAFAIYRSNFLDGNEIKIPLIGGNIFRDIKQGYTGGAVDVYKPQGKKIYRYDVNSLYPYAMKNYPMPVGSPIYFEGDIELMKDYNLLDKPFGFFKTEVEAPKNMNIPLLQTRLNNRTVAPIGSWTGTYFSEELNNAKPHGYKYKILNGYLFEKGYIFKEYVDYLYDLKVNSTSGSPNYTISKLLLNSLYGRFGMNPEAENHIIIDSNDTLLFNKDKAITNVIDLKNGKELISFFDDLEFQNIEKDKKTLNISVAISAAVTASARIHMSQFKVMAEEKKFNLYYSDTDSIDIDKPLSDKYIGKELGFMKLEHVFKKAVFLAPKVYGGITDSYEYVKVKGLKNPISFSELEPLLIKDSKLEINQDKWYRNISFGNITIKDEIYTLMINNSKRILKYNKINKFIDTDPITLGLDPII